MEKLHDSKTFLTTGARFLPGTALRICPSSTSITQTKEILSAGPAQQLSALSCPDDNTLLAFLEGNLKGQLVEQIAAHVDGCAACSTLMARVAKVVSWDDASSPPSRTASARAAPLALTDALLLARGTMVDEFRINRLLGSGGMGQVYLAQDTQLGRFVALKLIHAGILASTKTVSRFLLEARITAKFSHPNIMTILGVGEYLGRPYLVLEYVKGQTLRHRLRQQRLSLTEALRFATEIAKALREAHCRDVLHRDLKPSNILVTADGRIQVFDFGLAQIIESGTSVDDAPPHDEALSASAMFDGQYFGRKRRLQGTPRYMAPEQWRGRTSDDGATDIWAFGVLFYEMVAGTTLLDEAGTTKRLLKDAGFPASWLDKIRDAPYEVLQLIGRCLSRHATERPRAEELVETLERVTKRHRQLAAIPAGPFPGLLPFDRSRADLFFGRDADIAGFLERANHHQTMLIVGPSGSGKSSFVHAGIIPRLQERDSPQVIVVRPGRTPLRTLAAAVVNVRDASHAPGTGSDAEPTEPDWSRASSERLAESMRETPAILSLVLQEVVARWGGTLLVVDQMEEIFTLNEDEQEQWAFVQAVWLAADAAQPSIRTIVTMREEFLQNLAEVPQIEPFSSGITVLPRPSRQSLEKAVVGPVKAMGFVFDDPTLPSEMAAEVEHDASCLPLLQFAAQQLWTHRDSQQNVISREAYERMGGVTGSLSRHADHVLGLLSANDLVLARRILLRLVTPERTRRIQPIARVTEGLGAEGEALLSRLVDARLLVVSRREDAPEVELVHESLIASWGRLRRWIADSREELALFREISQVADAWERRGCRDDELWHGEALQDGCNAVAASEGDAPAVVTRFLEAGSRKQRRRARRRRAWYCGLVALLVGFMLVLVVQNRAVNRQRDHALEGQAEAQRESARRAFARGNVLEARSRIRRALEASDDIAARALWWRLAREPLVWSRKLSGFLGTISFSPDGRQMAVASTTRGAIFVVDVQRGTIQRVLRGRRNAAVAIAFSSDGSKITSASMDGEVWTHQDGTGRRLGVLGEAAAVQFSNAGPIAVAGKDGIIRVWRKTLSGPPVVLEGRANRVRSLAFSSNGRFLAASSREGNVGVWDTRSGVQLRSLSHGGEVRSVAFAPDGDRLVTACLDGKARIWNLHTGRLEKIFGGHVGGVAFATFSPLGKRIATADGDGNVRIWTLDNKTVDSQFRFSNTEVRSLRFSPDGNLLATAGRDDSVVCLWDTRSGHSTQERIGHTGPVNDAGFGPDGQRIASGGYDKTVRLWHLDGEQRRVLRGHTNAVGSVAFSPDGQQLASGDLAGRILLWPTRRPGRVQELSGPARGVKELQYSADGRHLAVVGQAKAVWLWTMQQRPILRKLVGHEGPIVSLSFSPNGRLLATGSYDRSARIWSVSTGQQVAAFGPHSAPVYVSFAPDNQRIAAASARRIVLWANDGRRVAEATLPAQIRRLAFHRDGRRIVAPCTDGRLRIWDTKTNEIAELSGHHDDINSVRISPDGRSAITPSDDGTIRLWDLERNDVAWRAPMMTTTSPAEILTHLGWRHLVAGSDSARRAEPARRWKQAATLSARASDFSADGQTLCLSHTTKTLQIWNVKSDQLLFERRLSARPDRVIATSAGCLVLAGGRLVHYRPSKSPSTIVSRGAVAAEAGLDWILAATGSLTLSFSINGERLTTSSTGPGVTALVRTRDSIVVGYREGNVAIYSLSGRRRTGQGLENAPDSAVRRLVEGPRRTLFAGYADGFVGMWDMTTGSQLVADHLHGPVVHLETAKNWFYAGSALGGHLAWNLEELYMPYCKLLDRVWRSLPIVRATTRPSDRRAPDGHRCLDHL